MNDTEWPDEPTSNDSGGDFGDDDNSPDSDAEMDALADMAATELAAEDAEATGLSSEDIAQFPSDDGLKPYEELVEENIGLKERLLKALAETENIRKRTEREKRDALKYGNQKFANDLLGVADNLHRALMSITDEARASADETLSTLILGIEMTESELSTALEKNTITRMAAEGAKFDPNFHQAIAEIANPDHPHGTVMDVVQHGYLIGERLLRPAMVTIAKGGPPAKPNPNDDSGENKTDQDPGKGPDEKPGSHINTTA